MVGNHGKTALILLGLQNEYCEEGGVFYDTVKDQMISNNMLNKIASVVKSAREDGALIIHSPATTNKNKKFGEEDDGVPHYPDYEGRLVGSFVEGTWNCRIVKSCLPDDDDIVLRNRTTFSAFEGTGLTEILQEYDIRYVFLMGFLTNACIQETAQDLNDILPDIESFVLSDGSAAITKAAHDHTIECVMPIIGANCVTCSEAQNIISQYISESEDVFEPEMNNDINEGTEAVHRPRILALCGAKSNNDVTKLQLENLHITEENYDIHYLQGPIDVEEADPDLEGVVHGPFYSWIDNSNEITIRQSLLNSIHLVLSAIKLDGPFDGIYGFSSGALVATLVVGIPTDEALREILEDDEEKKSYRVSKMMSKAQFTAARTSRKSFFARMSTRGMRPGMPTRGTTYRGSPNRGTRASIRAVFGGVKVPRHRGGQLTTPKFKFAILACSSFKAANVTSLREAAGLPLIVDQIEAEFGAGKLITLKSFHLIGIEDESKTKSEEVAALYQDAKVAYLPGGHTISSNEKSDDILCSELRNFAVALGSPRTVAPSHNFKPVSEVSSIALDEVKQVAYVNLKHELLPEGLYPMEGATIKALLGGQPKDKPFLYIARNTDSSKTTTYGELKSFIEGGDGDLRRIGVRLGEVVAYGAPPGGGAPAAVAFLSIGAQTAAAPLAPEMMEPDVLDALDQFNAKHLILFEGIDCPGVASAFEKWAKHGYGRLHRARIFGPNRPGLFEYIGDSVLKTEDILKTPPLRNPQQGTCLLLRTSGTTARPKGVPLPQGALVTNGAILAKSMLLKESDVCYSVMPLFHIGGISASILCTLASGGAVCCDGESFDPERMVDALAISSPQPTWYSSVPTIHNATVAFLKNFAGIDSKFQEYGVDSRGIWAKGHSLRMIRSGAAALLGPDGEALSAAYGGLPIFPTYSMSEQMPISQPPAGKTDTFFDKPGSVGVPVAASLAIVSRSNYRPQKHGQEGEIAISGPTVLKAYLENPSADRKSYFFLTGVDERSNLRDCRYFLTGDVGVMDKDGFVSLKGRAKELIKKGGEQVSPFEVEEPLLDHPWVQTPVVFSVPSPLYGEEVGCALILTPDAPKNTTEKEVFKEMRRWLKIKKISPLKWPTKWVICEDGDLPKTKTKKYIRVGLAQKLGLEPGGESDTSTGREINAKIDWDVISGFRFFLACYVMFMHIGSNKSWGWFNNLRGFPWHVHVFFTLGGFSMASPMNPAIKERFSYFLSRIGNMYPMYTAALIFGLINLLVVCRPSTFSTDFHWDAQPNDLYLDNGEVAPLFCEGTPATPHSYWASLFLTIVMYIFGLAVTPFWPINWWMGYYLWFSSMYYQCLLVFPYMYNYFFNRFRKNTLALLKWVYGLLVLNTVIIVVAWFTIKDGQGYNHYDPETGEANDPSEYTDGSLHNIIYLSFYLFGPFWALYFVIGAVTAFLYDAYKPAERHDFYTWGWTADAITLFMLGLSIACVCQGTQVYGEPYAGKYMRPDEADDFTDASNRLWDNLIGRIMCPITTLWVFALSTGEGFTASILRGSFLVDTLAPNSYNCFLFHQMVGQWYYAATRHGHWWNWWRYRKEFYWFSPNPCPVEWYEYFIVVSLVVIFSRFMDITVAPMIGNFYTWIHDYFVGVQEDERPTEMIMFDIIENMTGIEPDLTSRLDEVGLASVGVPVLVKLLNKTFSTRKNPLSITTSDLVGADTIEDMVRIVEEAKLRAVHQGV